MGPAWRRLPEDRRTRERPFEGEAHRARRMGPFEDLRARVGERGEAEGSGGRCVQRSVSVGLTGSLQRPPSTESAVSPSFLRQFKTKDFGARDIGQKALDVIFWPFSTFAPRQAGDEGDSDDEDADADKELEEVAAIDDDETSDADKRVIAGRLVALVSSPPLLCRAHLANPPPARLPNSRWQVEWTTRTSSANSSAASTASPPNPSPNSSRYHLPPYTHPNNY